MQKKYNSLISVIIPVYNVEMFLDRCIDSVINQTYDNLEIILVDDGSTDHSPVLCDNWSKKDSRIKVIHKKNGGLSDARNCGLDCSSGNYVVFIDSDDYVKSDMIETLFLRLIDDASDLALCNYLCVSDDENYVNDYENSLPVSDELIDGKQAQRKLFGDMHWHYVIACCKLYKKFLFDDFRFPVGKLHEDLFTTHLIFEKCNLVSCVREPLYYYYQNENSITHSYSIRRLDALDAYISRFNYFYEKRDYYCAAMSTRFMIEKLLLARKKLDMNDKKIKKRIVYYKKVYNKQFRKILFKKADNVEKFKMLVFYFGIDVYRLYNALRNRIFR
ncbi:MAG: glycosyltransferase [Acetobacter sp.]|nr:glycosyltransferase [Bacteroides sp.]MCM1341573.1 glycosyltransferase [Acetobacter sp.]MCM1433650.1 glycosyltransferase [Clostridiales bacterium]